MVAYDPAADDAGRRTLIRAVTAEAVRPLRHVVLRPDQPVEASIYPGDNDTETVHLGAFDGNRLVGVASLYREARPGASGGWRLRGMATEPGVRGRGFGVALLDACIEHVRTEGGAELWCNARRKAIGFYRRAGFAEVGEEFDIPDIGRHIVMTR